MASYEVPPRCGALVRDAAHKSLEIIVTSSREWTFEVVIFTYDAKMEMITYDTRLIGDDMLWQP